MKMNWNKKDGEFPIFFIYKHLKRIAFFKDYGYNIDSLIWKKESLVKSKKILYTIVVLFRGL